MPNVTVGEENGAPVELYYEDHGSGRPVVLLHGWPLSDRSWEKQVPALVEDGYRVITCDRRGFGRSAQPWEGYDYDTLAADLNTLLERLDLTGVTLVGFSMGGGEIARYVRTYDNGRVAKAVFVAANPPFPLRTEGNPDGALDEAAVDAFQQGIRADRVAFLDRFMTGFFAVGDRTDLVSEQYRAHNVSIAASASPKALLDCARIAFTTDFRQDLKALTMPTLVIHGDSDPVVPFEATGKRTAEAVENSRLVLVPDAPHGLNVTHAEVFNAELLAFLRS